MWRSPELARAQLPAHTKHASDVRGWAVRMPRVASAPEVLRRFGDHVKKELRKTQRWQLRASKRAAHCCRMLPGQLLPLQPCGSWCVGWCADVYVHTCVGRRACMWPVRAAEAHLHLNTPRTVPADADVEEHHWVPSSSSRDAADARHRPARKEGGAGTTLAYNRVGEARFSSRGHTAKRDAATFFLGSVRLYRR